jgi:hypothetical protein
MAETGRSVNDIFGTKIVLAARNKQCTLGAVDCNLSGPME